MEIRRNRLTRRWRVVLIGYNGEPLSTSEHLNSKQAALANIAAQRASIPTARTVEPD
jgi:hypothetical protein